MFQIELPNHYIQLYEDNICGIIIDWSDFYDLTILRLNNIKINGFPTKIIKNNTAFIMIMITLNNLMNMNTCYKQINDNTLS
jgi:hypothetical protein